jgi:class 3 adenylate cyclase
MVGYSRLMEADEVGTLAALKARRRDVLKPLVAKHQGRIIKVTGDSVLVEFASAEFGTEAGKNSRPQGLHILPLHRFDNQMRHSNWRSGRL